MNIRQVHRLDPSHFRDAKGLPVSASGEQELSVAVFGPGSGEAILIQLPNGQMGVVDGCREPSDPLTGVGDPVHRLLKVMDIQELAFVCMTHAHDDHYRGLATLLRSYSDRIAHVWWGGERELKFERRWRDSLRRSKKVGSKGDPTRQVPRIDDEDHLTELIEELVKSLWCSKRRTQSFSDVKRLAEIGSGDDRVKIRGLGPSTFDLHRALRNELDKSTSVRTFNPNAVSGALLIQWGDTRVLLGGDQLEGKSEKEGWKAVLRHIPRPLTLIKVAHHASEEAHHEPIWQPEPKLAIVTPYQCAAGDQPPKSNMLERLSQLSPLVLTAEPRWWSVPQHSLTRSHNSLAVAQPAPLLPRLRTPLKGQFVTAPDATDNAVLVRMNRVGEITEVVLAGEAAFYSRV